MVVSDISLVGWLLSSAELSSSTKVLGAVIGIGVITLSAFIVHKRIELLISKLKDL